MDSSGLISLTKIVPQCCPFIYNLIKHSNCKNSGDGAIISQCTVSISNHRIYTLFDHSATQISLVTNL